MISSLKKSIKKIKDQSELNASDKIAKQKRRFDAVKESVRSSNMGDFFKLTEQGKVNLHQENDILLKYAAYIGNMDVVSFLIKDGAIVDEETLRGAIKNNHIEVVKLLLQRGAKINADILALAIAGGDIDMFKYLFVKSKSKVNDDFIVLAMEAGSSDILNYLESLRSSNTSYAYKWENQYNNKKLSDYRILEAARMYKISEDKSIKEMRQELSKKIYGKGLPNNCVNTDSITGDSVEEIPSEFLYTFTQDGKVYCENLRAMAKLKKNPYTGKPLDKRVIDDILSKSSLLN